MVIITIERTSQVTGTTLKSASIQMDIARLQELDDTDENLAKMYLIPAIRKLRQEVSDGKDAHQS